MAANTGSWVVTKDLRLVTFGLGATSSAPDWANNLHIEDAFTTFEVADDESALRGLAIAEALGVSAEYLDPYKAMNGIPHGS